MKNHRLAPLYDEVSRLYLSGLSSRQVAAKLGISKSWAYKVIRRTCPTRKQWEAAILRQPATSKHWRSSRFAARKVWERNVGPIPEKHHIHHKDGDHTNNDLSNLQVVSPTEHAHIHRPPNPIPRWLRPGRQAYMKRYLKEYARARKTRVV